MSVEQSGLFPDLQWSEAGQQRRKPSELKLREPNRNQLSWAAIDLEELIASDHKARAIWHLAGQLDLTRFCEGVRTAKGEVGRRAWDPRLLVSIWIYALSEQVNSARGIERLMEYEPGLIWLSGKEVINHHTLSDFRIAHKEALDELFTKLLALLEGAGLVTLELVAHDGTKVAAQAGSDSFRREKTVQERLQRARQLLKDLEAAEEDGGNLRRRAAQLRAARQQKERLDLALAELHRIAQEKGGEEATKEARVSMTDPEARIMKRGDQSFGPSYNVHITTDSENKAIVAMEVTQNSSDANGLMPSLDQVQQRMGELPDQVVVDGGFTNEGNIIGAETKGVDLIGSLSDESKRTETALKSCGIAPEFGPSHFVQNAGTNCLECPGGKQLPYVRQSSKRSRKYHQYQAAADDCAACPFRLQCRPKSQKGRTVSLLVEEHPSMVAFRDKMNGAEAQSIYKQRGAIAEFPHAWIKEKFGLRRFRLRGCSKVRAEALWAGLTYNVMIWTRLVWRPQAAQAPA
jgi:transposase